MKKFKDIRESLITERDHELKQGDVVKIHPEFHHKYPEHFATKKFHVEKPTSSVRDAEGNVGNHAVVTHDASHEYSGMPSALKSKKTVAHILKKHLVKEAIYTDKSSWEEDMKEHGATHFEKTETRIVAKKKDGDILGAWSVDDKHGITGLGTNVQKEEHIVEDGKLYKDATEWRETAEKRGHTVVDHGDRMHAYDKKDGEIKGVYRRHHQHPHGWLNEDIVTEGKKRKKFLGQFRGKTATGQKANPIDTEPTLKDRRLKK